MQTPTRKSFNIPPEFQSELKPCSPLDLRSDAEILSSLTHHRPITSERNIWAFWHSGTNGMPAWCRRNVLGWHRINGPSWTIRVLDADPASPNYLRNFIPDDMLPAAILEGRMRGPFTGQHTADFVRSAVIYLYGGVFLDVGCLLIRRIDRICWDALSDDSSPYRIGIPSLGDDNIANHFVACRRYDPFIKRWHDLMLHIWKDRTESKGTIISAPLIKFLIEKDPNADADVRKPLGWDFKDPVTILEYVGQILAFQRMCYLDKADDEGFNCAEYWARHILTWNVLEEHWAAEKLIARVGPHPRIMKLLAMSVEAPEEGQEEERRDWQAAYEMTWRLLTSSSMQKVTSGQGMTRTPHLGVLWSMEENEGKDCGARTFAELLREGAVWFEQMREEVEYLEMGKLKDCVEKTLLEA